MVLGAGASGGVVENAAHHVIVHAVAVERDNVELRTRYRGDGDGLRVGDGRRRVRAESTRALVAGVDRPISRLVEEAVRVQSNARTRAAHLARVRPEGRGEVGVVLSVLGEEDPVRGRFDCHAQQLTAVHVAVRGGDGDTFRRLKDGEAHQLVREGDAGFELAHA